MNFSFSFAIILFIKNTKKENPLDLDPSEWSKWAIKAGATPVEF